MTPSAINRSFICLAISARCSIPAVSANAADSASYSGLQ